MSSSITEPVRWTRWRWINTIGLVFAAQVVLIILLSRNWTITQRQPSALPAYRLLSGTVTEASLIEMFAPHDPTLFALVNREGFSGAAWLVTPLLEHQWADWTNAPSFLKPTPEKLGAAFHAFMQTSGLPPLILAERTAPALADLPVQLELVATRSTLRVEGDLARRLLIAVPALPSIVHSEILSNSVVRVLVNRLGSVFSSTLLATSGSAKADALALELAKGVRFQIVPTAPEAHRRDDWVFTYGRLVFQWHTGMDTNQPLANPGS